LYSRSHQSYFYHHDDNYNTNANAYKAPEIPQGRRSSLHRRSSGGPGGIHYSPIPPIRWSVMVVACGIGGAAAVATSVTQPGSSKDNNCTTAPARAARARSNHASGHSSSSSCRGYRSWNNGARSGHCDDDAMESDFRSQSPPRQRRNHNEEEHNADYKSRIKQAIVTAQSTSRTGYSRWTFSF
jgi:hypothetical protein